MPVPTKRNDDLVQNVLTRLASGQTLTAACRANDIEPRTWQLWCNDKSDSSLAQAHADAVAIGHDAMAEQCIDIADTPIERIRDTAGNERYDSAHVAALKLRTDTRMKLLAKVSPKYADNRVEVTGANGGAIEVNSNGGAVAELVALIRAAKRGDGAPAPLALAKRPTALSDSPSTIGDSDATT